MPRTVLLNSDLGESVGIHSFGHDDELLALIGAANVACGFHAGDPSVIAETVAKAVRAGVDVGAHPGLPDLTGFGRRVIALTPEEVRDIVIYQVGALTGFLDAVGGRLSHVKPHGALFGMLSRDIALMQPVADLAARLGGRIFGAAGTAHQEAANRAGAEFVGELYVDLDYNRDGGLIIVRRPKPTDLTKVAERVRSAVRSGVIRSADETEVPIEFSSICIHSDTPNCVEVAKVVLEELQSCKSDEESVAP